MNALDISLVAYPFAAVGPDAVGGAEQVLRLLAQGLSREGRRPLVLACAGSHTCGELITFPVGGGLERRPADGGQLAGALTAEVMDRTRRFVANRLASLFARHRPDVVHFHGLDFLEYLPSGGPAAVVTLHLPLAWYPSEAFAIPRADVQLVCVSHSQRRACPETGSPVTVIENGVDLAELEYQPEKQPFALALARICPEKGLHLAARAARQANLPLLIGGQVFGYEAHERYFRDELMPALDSERRFLGPLGLEAKRRLLGRARCLIVSSLVDETSSLVAMEALACGTPVVAFRRGALPEVIDEGVTGFLVDSTDEMARALLEVERLRPEDCRRAAVARFSAQRMTRDYLSLYQHVAGRAHRPRQA